MLDETRMRTACFAPAPKRCTSRPSKHFLLTFQEVTPLSKTRNQLLYISLPTRDQPDVRGTHTLLSPKEIIGGRRSPLSSRPQPRPSWPACDLRPRGCAARRARSMIPRYRAPCACARGRPV